MDLCAFSWYKRYRKTHFFLAQFPTGRLVVGPSCIKNHKDHILEVNVRNAWNHWNQKLEIMRYMKNPSPTNSQNIIYLQTSSQFFAEKRHLRVFFCPLTFLAFCRFRLTAPVFMLKLPTTENRYFGHRFPSLEFKLRDLSGGSYFVLPGAGEANLHERWTMATVNKGTCRQISLTWSIWDITIYNNNIHNINLNMSCGQFFLWFGVIGKLGWQSILHNPCMCNKLLLPRHPKSS